MEDKNNAMNQNHMDSTMPQEIPIPDIGSSGEENANTGRQMNDPYQHNPYGQQGNDPYTGQQTGNPYPEQQTGDPYQHNPYGQQGNDPYTGQQTGNPYTGQQTGGPYAGQQNNDPYGGQNSSYNQQYNPYGGQVRPYVPQAQRKGNAAKIVIGVVCALVLVVALLLGAMIYMRSTPAYKISRGFRNLGKEISQSQNPLTEKAGMNEILQMMQEEGSHVDSSVNFSTDLPLLGSTTLGIDTDFYKDMHAKELNADTTLSLMNMDFAHLNIYADDEVFCFSIPELFMENMYIENENVVSQYNNSILAQLGSTSSMEDFSIDLFGEADGRVQAQEWRDMEAVWEKFETDLTACREGMTIGKVEKGLYRVTFPEKETNRLLKNLLDSYGKLGGSNAEVQSLWKDYKKLLSSDISVLLEINGSRIDSIMLEEPVRFWDDTASVSGEIFFLGEARSIDKIQGKAEIDGVDGRKRKVVGQIQQTSDRESWQIDMDLKYSEEEESGKIKFIMNCDAVDDEFDMTFSMDDRVDDLEIKLEGSLNDIVQGESLQIGLDQVSFSMDDEEVYRITGKIDIEPLQDRIKPTVEADTAFFEMSIYDWETIITKLDDTYGSILNSLW